MKKLLAVCFTVFVFFLHISGACGAIQGDINNDGRIDTAEAIYSLQVAAGVYPNVPTSCLLSGKGSWAPETGYVACDVVTFDEKQYVCNTSHTSRGALETDASYWDLLTLKGEKGDTGAQGPQGLQGIQGEQGEPGVGTPSGYSILGDTTSAPTGYTYSGLTVLVSGWRTRTYMSVDRGDTCSATVNGKIYVIGGYEFGNSRVSDVIEEYDPATDTWTTKQQMLASRENASCAAANGKVYVFGGRDSSYSGTKTSYVYDPVANSWTALADMPETTYTSVAATANNKIYIVGGTMSAGILEYDPATNIWSSSLTSPPTLRGQGPGAIVANDRLYIIGGYLNVGLSTTTKNESYDPVSDTWKTHTDMPVSGMANGVVKDGKIYLTVGSSSDAVYIYDPVADLWSSGPSLLSTHTRPEVGIVDNSFYVIGGYDNSAEQLGFNKYIHTKD